MQGCSKRASEKMQADRQDGLLFGTLKMRFQNALLLAPEKYNINYNGFKQQCRKKQVLIDDDDKPLSAVKLCRRVFLLDCRLVNLHLSFAALSYSLYLSHEVEQRDVIMECNRSCVSPEHSSMADNISTTSLLVKKSLCQHPEYIQHNENYFKIMN